MKQVIQCCYGTHKSSGFVIKQLLVPCPAPGPSSSPKSAEGAPERVLPAVGDGKLPAGHNLFLNCLHVWFASML